MNKRKTTWFDGLKCAEHLYKAGAKQRVSDMILNVKISDEFREGVFDYIRYHQNNLRNL